MVHQREGGGKHSSPHSVKYFGNQNPSKMGRCDLDCIIILFFTHLDAFGVVKVEESSHGAIPTDGTQFGKTRSEPFGSILRHQMMLFWGKTLPLWHHTISCYSTHKLLSNNTRNASIEVYMKNVCHSKV